MMDSIVRPARPSEASLLSELALRSKAYWGYPADFMAACRDELGVSAHDVRDNPIFVVEVDDRVRGFCSLERVSGDAVELGHLFVEPESIGTGLGRLLFEHARAEAVRRGYVTMVIQGDPNAAEFYRAVGARRIGRRESASVPGRFLPLFEVELRGSA